MTTVVIGHTIEENLDAIKERGIYLFLNAIFLPFTELAEFRLTFPVTALKSAQRGAILQSEGERKASARSCEILKPALRCRQALKINFLKKDYFF